MVAFSLDNRLVGFLISFPCSPATDCARGRFVGPWLDPELPDPGVPDPEFRHLGLLDLGLAGPGLAVPAKA